MSSKRAAKTATHARKGHDDDDDDDEENNEVGNEEDDGKSRFLSFLARCAS